MLALLIKASAVIIVLLAFYKIFLEKESFFAANRIYLLSCLIFAGTLPFIVLPKLVEHQGIVATLVESSEEKQTAYMEDDDLSAEKQISGLETTSSQLEKKTSESPIISTEKTSLLSKSNNSLEQHTSEALTTMGQHSERRIAYWLMLFYFFGVVVLLVKMLSQIVHTIWKIHKNEDRIEDEGVVLLNLNGDIEPCSFFKYIFINPASYEYETHEQIIAHEKIHVRQWHTMDLLMSELAVVALWFNPFIWLLRKEVEKNIEFQTDDLMIRGNAVAKESYQLNLVKISTRTQPLAITTNYNQSLLKQRILKINAKRSNQYSYWKYCFIAPVLFMLLLFLNQPRIGNAQNIANRDGRITADDVAIEKEKLKEDEAPIKSNIENAGCTELSLAIHDENTAKVKELLKTVDPNCIEPNARFGFDPDHYIKVGHRPLSAAAKTGNLEIAQLLLDAGSKIEFDDNVYLKSPLMAAANEGHLHFVKFLLEKGADINLIIANHGSALHCTARSGSLATISFLLDQGADINAYVYQYGTPLTTAARFGHGEIVNTLIDRGAHINSQNSALSAAAQGGHDEIIELLLSRGASIDYQDTVRRHALYAAAQTGQLKTVEFLLEKGASINLQNGARGTALVGASFYGHNEVVKLLLSNGAGIDLQNDEFGTALIAATYRGHIETVKLLLSKGAEIDLQTDGRGLWHQKPANTVHTGGPLHAQIDSRDLQSGKKMTALVAAARKGYREIVQLLLDQGSNINLRSDEQGTALHAAARNGRYKTVEVLLSEGADVNALNTKLGTALHAAVQNGHKKNTELLIAKGAHIHAQNDFQGSPLNTAARNGHVSIVELLLSRGADINAQTDRHGSALHAAARKGHLETVKLLISKGADIDQHCKGEGTALDAAIRNAHQDVINYFESEGG